MTDHPITPPPELVREWIAKFWDEPVEDIDPALGGYDLAARAAQWGADHELEACCKWLVKQGWFSADEHEAIEELRIARRPKPPPIAPIRASSTRTGAYASGSA